MDMDMGTYDQDYRMGDFKRHYWFSTSAQRQIYSIN
jgi:hypothetical protein